MLLIMENEAGEIIGAGGDGQSFLKSLSGEDSKLLANVKAARRRLKVRPAADPTDPDGLDDNEKIAAAAMDGKLVGVEEDIRAGRAPMRKSMSELLRELRQLGGPQAAEPLRKSFAPAAAVPQLGMLVSAASLAGRGVTLNR